MKKYWYVFFIGVIANAIVFLVYKHSLGIIATNDLADVPNFFAYFSPLIKFVELQLVIFGLWTVIDRIKLTQDQIDDLRSNNIFNQYVQHQKAFSELIDSSCDDDYDISQKQQLYRILFPKNSPRNFSPLPDALGDSPQSLNSIIKDFNKCVSMFNTLGRKTNGFNSFANKEICEAVSEYNAIRVTLGVSEQSDVKAKQEHSNMMGAFDYFPFSLSSSIAKTRNLLEGITHFCCKSDRCFDLESLNYSISEAQPAYYNLIGTLDLSDPAELGAFEEGGQAFLNDMSQSTCPYRKDTVEHAYWHRGWLQQRLKKK